MAHLGPRYYASIFGESSDYNSTLPWFHGLLSREQTEKLLVSKKDGLFLVRESNCFPGEFTLCVCYKNLVRNYRIKWYETVLTMDDEEFFDNLEDLIHYYQRHARGLCIRLGAYILKESPVCYIPEKDIQIRKTLQKGQFGDIYLGKWNGEKVTMKPLLDFEGVLSILKRSVRHENLIYLIGLAQKNNTIYLISSYISSKSLCAYLKSKGRKLLVRGDLIKFAYDISLGMEYLEKMCIVHKDLAARNIIITEHGIAKIDNFSMIDNIPPQHRFLPVRWIAPEALTRKIYTHKSDVWSYGIVLWELYSYGKFPYPKVLTQDIHKYILRGYRLQKPFDCPIDLYKIMLMTWDIDPSRRPSFRWIKEVVYKIKQTPFCFQDNVDACFGVKKKHVARQTREKKNAAPVKRTRHFSI